MTLMLCKVHVHVHWARIEVNFLQILQNLKFTLYEDFHTVITETLML